MSGWPIDEALKEFWASYGPGEKYRDYTEADEARLADRLPEVMRTILRKDGWCAYKNQVLWLCDPDDWAPAAGAWFPDAPSAQVVARSGFGDLFVSSGVYWTVLTHESQIVENGEDPNWFFGRTITAKSFTTRSDLPPKVRAARKSAGALAWDEMYAYEPALALGGSSKSSDVVRVKAREQLVLLSQLAPIERM